MEKLATGPFGELALLLGLTTLAGLVAVRLRQPVLIAYLAVGIQAGPAGWGLVTAYEEIALLAEIGVAVLLFLVGLRLDLTHVRQIGRVALATGLGQIGFTTVLGMALLLWLGRGFTEAIYVSVALTFSSTIIIVKLLSDQGEIDSLHGRIAVGFLIVQDIAVVLAMLAVSVFRGGEELSPIGIVLSLGVRIVAVLGLLAGLMRYVIPVVLRSLAASRELLLVVAIAWGTGLAALGEWAGFSKEAGAFLAGFSLASTPFREAMSSRLSGIRDFLLLFFFLDLGARLDLSLLGEATMAAVVLSAFVLIGNPLIVMGILGVMGYRKRTGFLAGLTVAQISEFSIVFVAMGIALGHVEAAALGLTTMVGILTITLSTYMILNAQPLYAALSPWLGIFERSVPFRELAVEQEATAIRHPEVLVFGLGRFGSRLLANLRLAGVPTVGVDFDPDVVLHERRHDASVRFGDAEDTDFVASLPLRGLRWVVTTVPDIDISRSILEALRAEGYQGRIALVARSDEQGAEFEARPGVTVLYPFREAVDHLAEFLAEDLTEGGFSPVRRRG